MSDRSRCHIPSECTGLPRRTAAILLSCLLLLLCSHTVLAQSKLETALGNLYGICLFENDANNPFAQAAALARASLAPGLNGFIESNLAAIPLTPPSVSSVFRGGEVANVVTGFAPVFTENASTVGAGKLYMGANFSSFNFSKIRGQELSETTFEFAQDDRQGDIIAVTMPMDISAQTYTVYATYGVTNRFDVGIALPIVDFTVKADDTIFDVRVTDNDSGCRYGPDGALCDGTGNTTTPALRLDLEAVTGVSESELSSVFLSTMSVRFKYRFATGPDRNRMAAVVDLRLPTRGKDSILGEGEFAARVTFIGEANARGGFTPHINLGVGLYDGEGSNTMNVAAGFAQLLTDHVAFTFDLLGELDLESDPFLSTFDNTQAESPVSSSSIPSVDRDHDLNTALGVQVAFTEDLHAFGSALFSLVDRGLHSTVAPTVGFAFHY